MTMPTTLMIYPLLINLIVARSPFSLKLNSMLARKHN